MTLVLPCSNCGRPFRSRDLSWVRIETPHYEDLPEPSPENYVDYVYDEDDEPTGEKVIRLYYCEMCLDDIELPPIRPETDPDIAPMPHHPGAEHDDGGESE